MEERLVIEPWKVELAQWYFNKDSPGRKHPNLKRREMSRCASASPQPPPPPEGDPPESACMNDLQDQGGLSSNPGLPSIRVSRPKLVSKMKKPEGEGKEEVSSASSKSVTVRPNIVLDLRKFPVKKIVQDEKDQGRNSVSVVLKSSIAAGRKAMKISERIRLVEDLSARYPVKYKGKSQNSELGEGRMDFCFHSAKHARHFFGKVNDLMRSGVLPQRISVFMLDEETLGRFDNYCSCSLLTQFYLQVTSIHLFSQRKIS